MKIWPFLHKLGSTKWFYHISQSWLTWLSIISFILMSIGLGWGLLFAPPDYLQGNSYRIIFIHVPSAFLASAIYIIMSICAIISLVWKIKMVDIVLKSSISIGTLFCLISLVTGSIWGKPTWGTWWAWDARLTSMLMLLFIYLAIMALSNAITNERSQSKACAILTLVGVINLPIIKFSVEWWNTLHQGSTLKITSASSIASSMMWPLLISICGVYCFTSAILLIRIHTEILLREKNTNWVKNILINHK